MRALQSKNRGRLRSERTEVRPGEQARGWVSSGLSHRQVSGCPRGTEGWRFGDLLQHRRDRWCEAPGALLLERCSPARPWLQHCLDLQRSALVGAKIQLIDLRHSSRRASDADDARCLLSRSKIAGHRLSLLNRKARSLFDLEGRECSGSDLVVL